MTLGLAPEREGEGEGADLLEVGEAEDKDSLEEVTVVVDRVIVAQECCESEGKVIGLG